MVWAVNQDQNAHMKTRLPLNSAKTVANTAVVVHCAKKTDDALPAAERAVLELTPELTELFLTKWPPRSASTLSETARTEKRFVPRYIFFSTKLDCNCVELAGTDGGRS